MADHRELNPDDLACIDLVNRMTDYLDGAVDEGQRRRIEGHLDGCEGCRVALGQFQTVIRLAGRLTPADVGRIDALARDRLMATLRVARRR
ncbi:MAG: anti-sigma factor [Chloroflexota bacterium]|nr:anti-sigma factor [Chloroflexota bacterium]